MWTKKNSYRENEVLSYLIFSRKIFYVTIVLCLNILWLKAINDITACANHTNRISVAKLSYNFWTVHKNVEYLTLWLFSSLWNIYRSTTAYFFDPTSRVVNSHDASTVVGVINKLIAANSTVDEFCWQHYRLAVAKFSKSRGKYSYFWRYPNFLKAQRWMAERKPPSPVVSIRYRFVTDRQTDRQTYTWRQKISR